jgi:hypothetical protein
LVESTNTNCSLPGLQEWEGRKTIGIMVCPHFGVKDGAEERGSREMKGEEEEAEDVLIWEMEQEAIKQDSDGVAM